MEIEEYVPERIQELCRLGAVSRYRLSSLTGISQSALSDIVKGENMPTLSTIEKICTAFGITISQFFAGNGEWPDLSEDQKELLCLWKELRLEEQEIVKTFMESIRKKRGYENTRT